MEKLSIHPHKCGVGVHHSPSRLTSCPRFFYGYLAEGMIIGCFRNREIWTSVSSLPLLHVVTIASIYGWVLTWPLFPQDEASACRNMQAYQVIAASISSTCQQAVENCVCLGSSVHFILISWIGLRFSVINNTPNHIFQPFNCIIEL